MKRLSLSLLFTISSVLCFAQESIYKSEVLSSGPMNGYAEMKEASIWLQTLKAETVYIEYFTENESEKKYYTDTLKTHRNTAYTATFKVTEVLPGLKYNYNVFVSGKKVDIPYPTYFKTQIDWNYKMPPPEFKMIAGSCSYFNEPEADRPGRAYGGEYKIFTEIGKRNADAMLWLGDNVYMRPVDWTSRQGFLHRYTHDRKTAELQPIMASMQHFAIWDDHDFGPNDSHGSYIGKEWAHEVYRLFWPMNAYASFNGEQSTTSAFNFNGIDFFLLDNRSFRTEQLSEAPIQILGKEQIEWLINNLKMCRSPFKMVAVGGQVLNDQAVYETHSVYAEEREYLLKRIEEENIKGVIFLTGDRHHSEVSVLKNAKGNQVWDFTISPLTSGPNTNKIEKNGLRVKGSLIQERNFAELSFSGAFRKRVLKVSFFSSDGNPLFEYEIKEEDIYKK